MLSVASTVRKIRDKKKVEKGFQEKQEQACIISINSSTNNFLDVCVLL